MADENEPKPFEGYTIIKQGTPAGRTTNAKCYSCGSVFTGPTTAVRKELADGDYIDYLPCPTPGCGGRGRFY